MSAELVADHSPLCVVTSTAPAASRADPVLVVCLCCELSYEEPIQFHASGGFALVALCDDCAQLIDGDAACA